MRINLASPNPIAVATQIEEASKPYKRAMLPTWRTNMRRMTGDYDSDLNDEENVFGRSGNRKVSTHTDKKLHAVLPLTNPKMHHSISGFVAAARAFKAVPATQGRKDRHRADATTSLLVARLHSHGGQDHAELYSLGIYTKVALPGFLLVESDKSKPRPRFLNQKGAEEKGDVIFKAFPAWRIHWEPGLKYVPEWTYAMVEEWISPYEYDRRWPHKDNSQILDDEEIYEKIPTQDPLYPYELGTDKALIHMRRIFIAPHGQFPNGAQRIILGHKYVKKIMDGGAVGKGEKTDGMIERIKGAVKNSKDVTFKEESIDTPDKQIPLIRFSGVPSTPTSLDRGQMDMVGTAQRLVNRTMTAVTDIKLKTPDIFIQLPSGMRPEQIHNDTIFLEQVQRVGGKGIEIALRPELSPFYNEIDWLNGKMDQILNQPAPSRGEVPGTRTSGKTMQLASQFSGQSDAPETLAFATGAAEAQKRVVLCGQEVWPKSFMIKVIGEYRSTELKAFETANLASVVDITTAPDDPWPTDKFARAKAINEMQKNAQFFGPPDDPATLKAMREAMKMPPSAQDARLREFQDTIIDRHVKLLSEGREAPVAVYCDDEMHMDTEAEILAEMGATSEVSEEIQKLFIEHIMFHLFSRRRKDKIESAGQLADAAKEEIDAFVKFSTLKPEERAAMAIIGQMEEGGGAPEQTGGAAADPAAALTQALPAGA